MNDYNENINQGMHELEENLAKRAHPSVGHKESEKCHFGSSLTNISCTRCANTTINTCFTTEVEHTQCNPCLVSQPFVFHIVSFDQMYELKNYYSLKRSLGHGNVFTRVCHSVHRKEGKVDFPACITGSHDQWGSSSRGSAPKEGSALGGWQTP